jgi:hypothetical protein
MRRFSKWVLWLLLIELVLSVAVGLRLRAEMERPLTYLGAAGSLVAPEPLDVGEPGAPVLDAREHEQQVG